ncbi:tetratricopeptide repeat protein [Epibacterium sp. SM1979]|uniref:protein O-GlcNAc transferase n=1 Tax=Tritonibacter litoralis TaxID=2662264 RepID=A0A843YH47_9RHOB|nr:tetratricopeptide repeat protein [Tritonibacter litoralis]MQQ10181.1 tetratricopeptide repeat protein [Tritonibacter litoralis]
MTVASSLHKAQRYERDQNFEDAAETYGEILARFPQNQRARSALDALRNRIATIDEPPADLVARIKTQIANGNVSQAATLCASNLNKYRKSHFLWKSLGQCHMLLGALNEAATCLNKALELNSKQGDTYGFMAQVSRRQGQLDNAQALFRKALSLEPENLTLLNDFGNLLVQVGQIGEAADVLKHASDLAPTNARVLFNYASALRIAGQMDAAQEMLEKAIEHDQSLQPAHFNLGQLHVLNGRNEDALPYLERATELSGSNDHARAAKLHAMAHLNDWRWVDEYASSRRFLGLQGIACSPFLLMAMEDNPDLLRIRTQAYAGEQIPQLTAPTRTAPLSRPQRLRIGYFSADFHSHATMHLMGGMFQAHDRDRFEIFAYSFGPNVDDEGRAQVRDNVDHFIEASAMSDADLAKRAHDDRLDIAIDLKGFTSGNRSAIFGARLAPIQIAYLGYPGSMGTNVYDYMITDWQVCPPGSERHYDEHLLRMPHSYQVNDRNRQTSDRVFSRSECGLPENGFVFCCFNNSYKITPQEFDIWMRLLDQVDGSVLWLLETSATSKANLRTEAQARGISPDRLIFAPRMDQADHLARHNLADLFLDTFVVNAHTTASDALWAGLPVLTMAGKQFAARVSASLLSAVGLPELITHSPAAYERHALAIAQDPLRLADIKARLNANRLTTPLFDTQCFTRDFEEGLDLAYGRWLKGEGPDHIDVATSSSGYLQMPNSAALA